MTTRTSTASAEAPPALGSGYEEARRHAEGCDHFSCTRVGEIAAESGRHEIPKFLFSNRLEFNDPIRIAIFGGLHGDEPASWEAIYRFIQTLSANPELGKGYEVHFYPVCNPAGLRRGTRENGQGLDLNREFWKQSNCPEVQLLEEELLLHAFQGVVTLHADDTAEGLYGYTHGRLINESLVKPALAASEAYLPRDRRAQIDGFPAENGLIRDCFKGILSAPCHQNPQPFDIILETPALAPLSLQIEAASTALGVILTEYRRFVAYAQDL